MIIDCKTGEKVNSLKQYYRTKHWIILVKKYMDSELSKLCYKCRESSEPSNFHHRTKIRIGREKLTDISPICRLCSELDSKPKPSKKKAERRQLASFGFNYDRLSDGQKRMILAIKPRLRGYELSKMFSQRANPYKPSQRWVNSQVKKACKWIRQSEKELLKITSENV